MNSIVPTTPYTLNLNTDINRILTINKRVYFNEYNRKNSSSIIVFRNYKDAKDFKQDVMRHSDIQNFYSVSYDIEECFKHKNHRHVVFNAPLRNKTENIQHEPSRYDPVPFDFEDDAFLDKLITYNISVLFMDSYYQNVNNNQLSIFGTLWTPPTDIIYYHSDIECLYKLYD